MKSNLPLKAILISTDNLVDLFAIFHKEECWHTVDVPAMSNIA